MTSDADSHQTKEKMMMAVIRMARMMLMGVGSIDPSAASKMTIMKTGISIMMIDN